MVGTQIRPLTIEDYHRTSATGIIHEDDRLELIAGQIFNIAAKGTKHTVCTRKLFKQLLNLIGDRADIQSQDPIG